MPKAINWAESFYDEVLSEDCESDKLAIRPGSLYFDNSYYVVGDTVDIRVNGNIIRRGIITKNMELCKIQNLSEDILSGCKSTLRQKADVISFIREYYKQEADNNSKVTLIFYKNLPIENSLECDDPHLS